jgi:hypothetical protein
LCFASLPPWSDEYSRTAMARSLLTSMSPNSASAFTSASLCVAPVHARNATVLLAALS